MIAQVFPTLKRFHAKAQRKQRAQKRIYRDNRINRDKKGNHESTRIDTNQDKTVKTSPCKAHNRKRVTQRRKARQVDFKELFEDSTKSGRMDRGIYLIVRNLYKLDGWNRRRSRGLLRGNGRKSIAFPQIEGYSQITEKRVSRVQTADARPKGLKLELV